jgi:hypothetical protein
MDALSILMEDTSEWYNGEERLRTPAAESPEYSQNAAGYFAAQKVPGTNMNYRDVESPEATNLRASNRVAWRKYMVGIEAIQLEMEQKGVGSFESAEGYMYKQLKQQLIDRIDSDHKGWGAAFIEQQGSRANAAIRVITTAFNNPDFVKRNEDNPFWSKSGPMYTYLVERQRYLDDVAELKADAAANGHVSLQSKDAAPWAAEIANAKERWDGVRLGLRKSPTFSAIYDRFLDNDDKPVDLRSDAALEEAS